VIHDLPYLSRKKILPICVLIFISTCIQEIKHAQKVRAMPKLFHLTQKVSKRNWLKSPLMEVRSEPFFRTAQIQALLPN
jgi:hypothetical protein